MYFLYVKFKGQTQFRPMNWSKGTQVINLMHASMFTPEEVRTLKTVDLPANAELFEEYEFRKVRGW